MWWCGGAVMRCCGALRCLQRSTLTAAVSLLSAGLSSMDSGAASHLSPATPSTPPTSISTSPSSRFDAPLPHRCYPAELCGQLDRLQRSAPAQPLQTTICLLLLTCRLLQREMGEEEKEPEERDERGGCEGEAEAGGVSAVGVDVPVDVRLRGVLGCWRRLRQSAWLAPLLLHSDVARRAVPELGQLSVHSIVAALHHRLSAAHSRASMTSMDTTQLLHTGEG